jgi:hypothetical protein
LTVAAAAGYNPGSAGGRAAHAARRGTFPSTAIPLIDPPHDPAPPPPSGAPAADAAQPAPARPQFPYVARPLWWFVLLNLLSAGLYQVVFFYRGWTYLRDRHGADVWPLARALLGPLFAYPLFRRYFTLAQERGYPESPPAGPLAVAFIAFRVMGMLPLPAGLVSMMSVLTLLPAAETQNYVWSRDDPDAPRVLWVSRGEVVLVAFGIFAWVATFAVLRDPSLLPTPP